MDTYGNPSDWVNLEWRPGWPVRNGTLIEALGLRPGHKLPEEGLEPVWVGNVRVRIWPRDPNKSRKAHRTEAECPTCATWVCAGHLHQHMKIHRR